MFPVRWWGFTTAADRQRLEPFLCRARRSGLYHTDRPTVAQLAVDADDTLFSSVTHSSNQLLHVFNPNILTIHITLDQGPTVSNSAQHDDRNFIDRMLFREAYSVCVWLLSWLYFIHLTAVFLSFCTSCYCVFIFLHNLFTAAFCHLYFIQ